MGQIFSQNQSPDQDVPVNSTSRSMTNVPSEHSDVRNCTEISNTNRNMDKESLRNQEDNEPSSGTPSSTNISRDNGVAQNQNNAEDDQNSDDEEDPKGETMH